MLLPSVLPVAVVCEEALTPPPNGQLEVPEIATFMSVATYTCINRHTLIGEAERECLANRTWSGEEPECQCKWRLM